MFLPSCSILQSFAVSFYDYLYKLKDHTFLQPKYL